MRKKILVIIIAGFVLSCDSLLSPATLEIEVSYYYNHYIGYKPDIGARAYLFKEKDAKNVYIDSMLSVSASLGYLVDINGEWLDVEMNLSNGNDNVVFVKNGIP